MFNQYLHLTVGLLKVQIEFLRKQEISLRMPDRFEDTQGNQSSWSSVTRRSVGKDEGKRDHILSGKSWLTFTLKKECQGGGSDQLCQMLQIGKAREESRNNL